MRMYNRNLVGIAVALGIFLCPLAANSVPSVTNWVERGNQATIRGDLVEALQDYTKATNQVPGDPVPWYDRALTYKNLGRIPEATADARRAIELQPSFSDGCWLLAHLLQLSGNTDEALSMASRAVGLTPDSVAYRSRRAAILVDMMRPSEAKADYEFILGRNPNDLDSLQGLAYVLFSMNDQKSALLILKRYITLVPVEHRDDTTVIALADLLMGHGRYADAFVYLSQHSSTSPRATESKARALLGMGRRDEALALLSSSSHEGVSSLRLRGIVLFEGARCAEAADAFREASRLEPKDALTLRNLGAAFLCANQVPAARDALRRAIRLNPADTLAYRFEADASRRLGDLDDAVRNARTFLALGGDDSRVLLMLGVDEYRAGDKARGTADYERGCSLAVAGSRDLELCKAQLPKMKATIRKRAATMPPRPPH
jgi:tetratricopeptide (TPR) repeat protein